MKNKTLLQALLRQPVDYTPVWIMRQAGRYLPEYRRVRARAGKFLTLCQTPQLAAEVTLQPVRRFPLDAAILFSDILTIPAAMNLGLEFIEGEGPQFTHPIRDEKSIASLPCPNMAKDLAYVMETIDLIKSELKDRPLIGFAGSPWTLAAYMIEGHGSKDFHVAKKFLYQQPQAAHQLLQLLSVTVIEYLNAQIDAGVDVIMLFDTWGGVLSTEYYQRFSLDYMTQIAQKVTKERAGQQIPLILFTKNGAQWLPQMLQTGADALGIDWTVNLGMAREQVGHRVALQGNLDPAVLYAKPEVIRHEVRRVLAEFGRYPGHVFNLGHGIYPDVDPEHVAVLVDAVHEYSGSFHITD